MEGVAGERQGRQGELPPLHRRVVQVRSIGVSNFNAAQMQRLLDAGGDAPCSILQVGAVPARSV